MEEQREVPSSWCAVPLGRKQVGVLDGSDARRRRNVADIDACDNMPGIEYADCTPQRLFLVAVDRWKVKGGEKREEKSLRSDLSGNTRTKLPLLSLHCLIVMRIRQTIELGSSRISVGVEGPRN